MSSQQTTSIWNYKPWWCQPWSILLTGTVLISGSWVLFKTLWLTVLVAIPLTVWMVFFVLVYPQLIRRSGLLDELQPSDTSPGTSATNHESPPAKNNSSGI